MTNPGKTIGVRVLIILTGILLSSFAWAQSATNGTIAGVVKDSTGAVLPGVTVEAASPALIEKVRSVVTDEKGAYKIVDLRPGTYSVTFTLTGFGPLRRDAIELVTGFTATVNGELKVGSLQETVTVTGGSPVVDLQNSRSQQVLKSQVLDSLPSAQKDFTSLASMTLGAVASVQGRNDVGGDRSEQNTGIVSHGGRGDDGRANYDGMSTNVLIGGGGGQMRRFKFNTVSVEEVVLDTGGSTAESENGGGNLNMVPKDGGNLFSILSVDNFANHGMASSSVPSDLLARGSAPNQNSVKKIYDFGVGVGGPIVRDRLWFYSANRWWGAQNYGANNYFNMSTNPNFYVPDLSRPAFTDQKTYDYTVRVTWQAANKHKIAILEDYQQGCGCWLAIGSGALSSPEATTSYNYGPRNFLTQATWSNPATSRLLFQAGISYLSQPQRTYEKVDPNGGPVIPTAHSITELVGVPGGARGGYTYGALAAGDYHIEGQDDNNLNGRASLSYITGSHAFKGGMQGLRGNNDSLTYSFPDGTTYTFRAGVPVSLTERATPLGAQNRLRSIGLFAQDQWTLKRLTLNYGMRFDHFWGYSLPLSKPAGPFVPARTFAGIDDAPNYKDISPRVGAAYDVFGNGKTAIKGSWGRYLLGQGAGILNSVAPANAIVQSVTRTWNDANGNYVPDCDLTNNASNGECGTISNAQFGQPTANLTWAPDARTGWGVREYNQQITAQLQQELRPGISVSIGYFRTWWGNFTVLQNTAVTPSDFTPFCVTAPTDTRLGQYSAQPVCGLYDVNPNKFGQVQNVITEASNFGTQKEVYNGVDFGFNARFGKGALVQGGLTLGRTDLDTCYANNYPNITPENVLASPAQPRSADYCHVVSPLWDGVGSQIKVLAVYPLPWSFQLSGTYKNLPGIPWSATLVETNAQIAPALGRNLSSCPATGTCTATFSVPLLPSGNNGATSSPSGTAKLYDTRLNQVDLRLARVFRVGKARLLGTFDAYNVFDNRVAQGILTTYGSTWLLPTSILGGRLFKVGGQFSF